MVSVRDINIVVQFGGCNVTGPVTTDMMTTTGTIILNGILRGTTGRIDAAVETFVVFLCIKEILHRWTGELSRRDGSIVAVASQQLESRILGSSSSAMRVSFCQATWIDFNRVELCWVEEREFIISLRGKL